MSSDAAVEDRRDASSQEEDCNSSGSAQWCKDMVNKLVKPDELAAKCGLRASEVPAALVSMQALFFSQWCGMLFVACRYQPLRRLAKTPLALRMRAATVEAVSGSRSDDRWLCRIEDKFLKKSKDFGENRFVRIVPRVLRMAPNDFTLGIAESCVLYYATAPGLFVLNAYLTGVIIRVLRRDSVTPE
eukprot:TRINITY_DN15821_c0_g1_i1.p1 TRINITY_DN15821_c0_g1~~TRINITY_DN15821_c0_g1_i1.p1  ORF type:complete len:187 (+),score=33.33 TRINITY_DN15821_c0_g1_i1:108-668(+)